MFTVIEIINNSKKPLFTFELLPPLKGHSIERTYAAIDRLIEFEPAYNNGTSINAASTETQSTYEGPLTQLANNHARHRLATAPYCNLETE